MDRFPKEHFVVVEYTSYGQPAILKCEECGQEIKVNKAGNFLAPTKAYGCKNCHGLWREREKKMAKLLEKYDIVDQEVRGTHKYYTIKCKNCGHIRQGVLNNFMSHLDCGCTTGVFRRTKEEVAEELEKDGYDLLSEFEGMTEKILVRHRACGFIRKVRAADLLYGNSRCPRCERKESRGVQLISKILTEAKVPFVREKSIETGQRFDFYLEWCNTAIEYNGEQHYHWVDYFHRTPDAFEIQQERDTRKQEYCKNNNIRLIIIPYADSPEEIHNKIQQIINEFNDQSRDVESSDSK